MPLLVTSASGVNGDGFGALLAFDLDGAHLGTFGEDERIIDPRGLGVDSGEHLLFVNSGADRVVALDAKGTVVRDTGPIAGLNPGGGNFGPDGRYHVGLRSQRSIMGFSPDLGGAGDLVVPPGIVPFPRGFAFDAEGRLFLASGIGPSGEGDDTIIGLAPDRTPLPSWHVEDPELSPLDLAIAPNGNVLVSSERPFGAADAVVSLREYDRNNGRLVRVFSPKGKAGLRKPRGLRFGPSGRLYCVGQDEVVAFDFGSGECLGAVVTLPRLNGQAVIFFP